MSLMASRSPAANAAMTRTIIWRCFSILEITANGYSALAASVFAIVAVLQFAVNGWPVTIGTVDVPVRASWFAFIVAGLLAALGYAVAFG